jgi:3-oxoacyl-[acyl-carrier-protein] synthase II
VAVAIAASAVRTCLGDDAQTFAALLAGRSGIGPLRRADPAAVNVWYGYQIDDPPEAVPVRAGRWLAECATRAVAAAGVDPRRERVVAVIGTGLRELSAVERWATGDRPVAVEDLHFGPAVRAATGIEQVCTLSNACSAGGSALALGQDIIETGEADAVVVGAADTMTESMLAMIGRVADPPTAQLRPFDAGRGGVLLGEGAAALVLVPDRRRPRLARLLGTGLSCDAHHETAPDPAGIRRAMTDALDRAGREPADVDVVVAHGTGTALNDPTEARAIADVLGGSGRGPLVTAVKGALGHTSGAAALHSIAVAVNCLRHQRTPAVVGLRDPLPEAAGLALVRRTVSGVIRSVQVNAFGFGGLNAVSLLERP